MMESMESLSRKAQFYKENYPPGTRIMLISMDDPYAPVAAGTKGTIDFVDDFGQLHMTWDNGRTLAVVPGVDSFRKLSEQELIAETPLSERISAAETRAEQKSSGLMPQKAVER